MSRMSAVRSMILTGSPTMRSRLDCWEGVSSSSKMKTSASMLRTYLTSSSTLPLPMNVLGTGASSRWLMVRTTSAPSVCARRASSASDSSHDQSDLPRSTPTRIARSGTGAVLMGLNLSADLLICHPHRRPGQRRARKPQARRPPRWRARPCQGPWRDRLA